METTIAHKLLDAEPRRERRFDARGLVTFYLLTLALTWAAVLPVLMNGDTVGQGEGWWPTHVPALLMPMVAALAVTTWRRGRIGLTDLLRRMTQWRVGWRWWLAGLGLPATFIAVGLIAYRIVESAWPAAADFGKMTGMPAMGVLATFAFITLLNGFGEETG